MATSSTTTRSLPFLALGGLFEADDVETARRVISAAADPGGNLFPLPEEAQFQDALAKAEGARKAVAVNSCGTALDLCMMALGVGPGDEVITTPLTFVCTATCASARGAKVVFADVDAETLCLDAAAVRRAMTPRTKAIIPVHFAGLAADIDGFDAITRDTGIPVVYDAAHAVGARHNGRPIGGAGRASCYSFQSNKNLTTLGEGGAVTTDDEAFAEVIRQKKTFGYVYGGPRVRVVTVGFNYRLTKPQLAVGLTQLAKLERVNGAKRERMRKLRAMLADVDALIQPVGFDGDGHAAHLYVMRIDSTRVSFTRDAFQAHLKDRYRIATALHYPAVWDWEAFQSGDVEYDRGDCPIATRACQDVLSLPVFPQTNDEELEYLAASIRQAVAEM